MLRYVWLGFKSFFQYLCLHCGHSDWWIPGPSSVAMAHALKLQTGVQHRWVGQAGKQAAVYAAPPQHHDIKNADRHTFRDSM